MPNGKLIYTLEEIADALDEDPVQVRDALCGLNVRMMRAGVDADLSQWQPRVQSQPDGSVWILDVALVPGPGEVIILADSLPTSWLKRLDEALDVTGNTSALGRTEEARQAVREHDGNKTHAAISLSISRRELNRRLEADGPKKRGSSKPGQAHDPFGTSYGRKRGAS